MLEQFNDEADLESVYRYLAQHKKGLPYGEIMNPPVLSGRGAVANEEISITGSPTAAKKPSLEELFEHHSTQERDRVKRLIELDVMQLKLKFKNRKGQILSGRIWLASSYFGTLHLIDEADPLKTSYPVTFEELRSLNPDFVPHLWF